MQTDGELEEGSKNVILEASGASEYFWRALEGLTAIIQYDQQCTNVLVWIGVRGEQQGTVEQKLQCESRLNHTPGWHCSQNAPPDLYT